MKIIGILLINIVCTVTGIYFAYKTKERCETARQLLQMADMMAVELSFSADNSRKIVNRLRKEKSLSRLSFLNDIDFENINIKTGLDPADDEKVNMLFRNLGSTDVQSMLKIINTFKKSISASLCGYTDYSKSHSRLFTAFGVLGGLAVSIMLI